MANLNVRKGDNVMVITGKDKGKSGKVLAVQTKKGRIYVEGVNIVAKSKKPRSAQDKGGILKREGTIDISNVMIICPSCKQVVRVRHEDAPASSVVKTIRVCAKCGASLDEKKTVKKAAAKKTVAKKAEAALRHGRGRKGGRAQKSLVPLAGLQPRAKPHAVILRPKIQALPPDGQLGLRHRAHRLGAVENHPDGRARNPLPHKRPGRRGGGGRAVREGHGIDGNAGQSLGT